MPLPIIVRPRFERPATRLPHSLSHHVTASPAQPSGVLKALIAPELAGVDQVIQQRLASDVALVNQIAQYIVNAGGKRVRPQLVLLVAGALGFQGPERFELAAVVEFIHTATLLHDDVVDESDLRRGRQTANAVFGNAASVLVGDFLYSRAFQMMVSVERMRVLQVLADATNVIAQGEVLQLMNMHDPDITVADYFRVIRYKTARLFEASARLGAILADAEAAVEENCAELGDALGVAFQLVDDLLDYGGSTAELGKNVGDDLREGKPTYPLLIALERAPASEQELLRAVIREGGAAQLDEVLAIIRRCDALEATRQAALEHVERGRRCALTLPASTHREALLELLAQSVARVS